LYQDLLTENILILLSPFFLLSLNKRNVFMAMSLAAISKKKVGRNVPFSNNQQAKRVPAPSGHKTAVYRYLGWK
jgi:hypothetical protein